jgi:hypothetical protein
MWLQEPNENEYHTEASRLGSLIECNWSILDWWIGTEIITWEKHRKHDLLEWPGDLPIVEVGFLASNKHLNNTIQVYHDSLSFRGKVSGGKGINREIQIEPKWEWHEKSFSKPIFKGVRTIYGRNKKNLRLVWRERSAYETVQERVVSFHYSFVLSNSFTSTAGAMRSAMFFCTNS